MAFRLLIVLANVVPVDDKEFTNTVSDATHIIKKKIAMCMVNNIWSLQESVEPV